MENSVLISPAIVETIHEKYIAVELFTDFPEKNPEEQVYRDLLRAFSGGPSPIPVYLIVSPDGKTVFARRDGKTSEEDFARFLDKQAP